LEKFIRLGGGGGGTVAKDALGNDIVAEQWLNTHGPGDRTLSQGLKVLAAFLSFLKAHVFHCISLSYCINSLYTDWSLEGVHLSLF
jgi:hypothetical protein